MDSFASSSLMRSSCSLILLVAEKDGVLLAVDSDRDWILPGQGRDLRIIRADILRRPDGNAMVHSNTSY